MTLRGFALSWAPIAPHPERESCVITPSSTLTQTLPAQWFTPALPPAFAGTASWNPRESSPRGGRGELLSSAAHSSPGSQPRGTAGGLYLSQVCSWLLTFRREGRKKKVPFLRCEISPPFAVLKVLQSQDRHLHNCLPQTLLELKHSFCVTTISALAGSKNGF